MKSQEFKLYELFDKKTIKGVPKIEEDLTENTTGYHVFGQNIKYQYPQKVLLNEKYLQVVKPEQPILAYTSSVGEIGIITESFYRTGDNGAFQGLFPKTEINIRGLLYILTLLKKHFSTFGYSTSMTKIMELSILLPVVESSDLAHEYTVNDIDWQYMQERIAELEQERIAELDTYLKVTGLENYELTEEDRNILCLSGCFKKYTLGSLFTASTGDVDLQQKDINGKGYPVVSSGLDNQGVIGYSDIPAKVLPANTITIDMFGNVFFRDFEYKEVTHARIFTLIPKSFELSVGTGLYIVSILSRQTKRFSYNNMATWNKLRNVEISLPVLQSGEIDFDYMERYIRAIEKLVIVDVVKYKDKVIATTKKVVNSST